ncbi:MAG: hypothetical protein JNK47_16780 [Mesorhizobium sp.]|nr:hypothetical protein [Mesorhizobium sp.]MBL8578880.1 hypothetical protein [Mesorhizobium sp.]
MTARRIVDPEAAVWIGARYAPANDNRGNRRWTGEENYGPTADLLARKADPGAAREYTGDVASRLLNAGNLESYFVLRSVRALLSPVGLSGANDNGAEDADNEMRDGFGLDYAIAEDNGEKAVERFLDTGLPPSGVLRFRQRSGNPGSRITAKHRREEREGRHVDRYLSLRGVPFSPSAPTADGEPPWRSHRPINAIARAELAAACERTEKQDGGWRKVTWTRYAPIAARVYGGMAIYSEMKGVGEGKTSASSHPGVRELYRQGAENEFRAKMSGRSMGIIDAILQRDGYEAVGEALDISRNGAKKAVKSALREAWTVLHSITGEALPEKIAA